MYIFHYATYYCEHYPVVVPINNSYGSIREEWLGEQTAEQIF